MMALLIEFVLPVGERILDNCLPCRHFAVQENLFPSLVMYFYCENDEWIVLCACNVLKSRVKRWMVEALLPKFSVERLQTQLHLYQGSTWNFLTSF